MRRSGHFEKGVDHYGIYEVYYDDNGDIDGWTETTMEPSGESLDDLKEDMRYMCAALENPVLDYETGKEIE